MVFRGDSGHPSTATCMEAPPTLSSRAKPRDLLLPSVHPIERPPNKSRHPPLVIPSAAERSAVRPGSRTKVSVPFVLPQNRHPERSASQLDRVTQHLWRGVEGPRRCLIYPCCSELFDHRRRQLDLLARTQGKIAKVCPVRALVVEKLRAACEWGHPAVVDYEAIQKSHKLSG